MILYWDLGNIIVSDTLYTKILKINHKFSILAYLRLAKNKSARGKLPEAASDLAHFIDNISHKQLDFLPNTLDEMQENFTGSRSKSKIS